MTPVAAYAQSGVGAAEDEAREDALEFLSGFFESFHNLNGDTIDEVVRRLLFKPVSDEEAAQVISTK